MTTFRIKTFALVSLLIVTLLGSGCSYVAQTVRQETTPQTNSASPSSTSTPEAERISRPVSEPYTGDLAIFEDAERDKNLSINRVMDVLKISEGKTVADLGAGSGWFTTRAARRVGANGMVYAVEINKEYINYINQRAEREKLPNIKTVLGTEDDPRLPAKSVDAVLILKTYHEIAQPLRVMSRLRESLKPGGRVGIIDRNGNGSDHGIARDTVVSESEKAGFKLVEEYDFVKPDNQDYLLVFEAKN